MHNHSTSIEDSVLKTILGAKNLYILSLNITRNLGVYEFAGLEPRIGLLEWTTGMDHWS